MDACGDLATGSILGQSGRGMVRSDMVGDRGRLQLVDSLRVVPGRYSGTPLPARAVGLDWGALGRAGSGLDCVGRCSGPGRAGSGRARR